MVDLGHGSFFVDDEYIDEARFITPEGISENLGAHDNVQVSVDVASDTVTLASGGNLFQIALAKVIEAASKGEHLEIDVGGNTVVVTGNPIPSINHVSMIESDCGPAAELYEDKPRFKQPFKMRDRKTTAMLAKRRFR